MSPHLTPLHADAAAVVATPAGVSPDDIKVEAPPRPELGDFAIGCFAIAKQRGQSPAQVAQEIAAGFQPTELLASATAAGPFVNLRASRPAALRWIVDAALRSQLIPRQHGAGQTICIDYSSPNISKHLAYHHIRGTTIGHALAQIFRAIGCKVIGINFLGDWGTTHGMVIAAYKKWGAPEPLEVSALNDLYVRFREAMKQDPTLGQEGRDWFRKLEDGDLEARTLWSRFRDVSWAEYQSVYELLGIEFDEVRGESAYEAETPRIVQELTDKGLLSESEGAQVVQLDDEKTPLLIKTRDGTSLYATRDIAAAEYHWNTFQFTRSLYVVDRGQALHFRQVFALLSRIGRTWANRCQHVPYGLVRVGGKKTGTRLGNVVLMREVFAIAEAEVREKITSANPELPPDVIARVAREVGIGAVVFANLAPQREKDVDFDLDKAVSLDGDSGPYLQYSHARCASIARKAQLRVTSTEGIDFALLTHDAEWAVARRLLDFPDAVIRAANAYEPHVICHYLLELAGDFSRWYTTGNGDPALRVLCEDLPTRRARLALLGGVQHALRDGLALLGLAAPDQM